MSKRRDRVEFYRDSEGQWRWRYRTSNGHIMADSGQGYSRRIDCMRAASRVVSQGRPARDDYVNVVIL